MTWFATSEEYFATRDSFIAYVVDEINPARIKAGLSELREHEARECFRIMHDFFGNNADKIPAERSPLEASEPTT